MKIEMKICSICGDNIDIQYKENGEPYWSGGHNAQPVNDGICCSECNMTVVLPTRLKDAMGVR